MRLGARSRRDKPVDGRRLRVHAWTPAGLLSAGLLTLDEDGHAIAATFEYDSAYLAAPGAYPLDPLNLPFGLTIHATDSRHLHLGAIFDSAPDAWGRKVVTAQLPQEVQQRVFRGAFLKGADGIGALVFTLESLTDRLELEHIIELSLAERPGLSQLARASRAAMDFEAGLDMTDDMRDMLAGSWTIGGARPKAILRDDRQGAAVSASVIAKFDSKLDTLPRNRIEAACLAMAQAMGFNVPAHELVEIGPERTALILERFDRQLVGTVMQRRHYISAMSLVSYEPQSRFLNSSQDQAKISWSKLLELSSRTCEHPTASRVEMFARLALNTALQNTDDHLKNFGFIKSPTHPTRYEIAPVFDVSAQAGQRHYLRCLDLGQTYSLDQVMPLARRLAIAKGAAEDVQERIISVISRQSQFFDAAGLTRVQAAQVSGWISDGCGNSYTRKVGTSLVESAPTAK